MRRKHAAHTEEEHENHERWLLTYADLITLLLALFMMLYAMSVLDLRKYQAFQEAFTQGMGGHKTQANDIAPERPVASTSATPAPPTEKTLDQDELKKLKLQLEKTLHKAGLEEEVQVQLEARGLVMNVVSGVLFDSASATLTTRGHALLTSLEAVLKTFGNKLVIEGHTDPRPISSAVFPSNWELSTARATAVLRGLLADGIRDTRLSAAGYADTRPRTANTTETGMARNRRVDIVVLAGPRPKAAATTPPSTPPPAVAPAAPAGGHH